MRASRRPRCTSSCRTRRGARSSMACTACRPYTCSSLIDDVAYLLLVLRLRGPAEGVSSPLPPLRGPLDVLRLPDLPSLAAPLLLRLPLSPALRSEEHTSELQSRPHLVCRLLLEKK